MHKESQVKFRFPLRQILWALSLVLFSLSAKPQAWAEIRDAQSFKPIAWESDFAQDNSLSLTWLNLPQRVQLTQPEDIELYRQLRHAFGLQLGKVLRESWQGRVGFFVARTSPETGGYVWSFLGSDLQRELVPAGLFDHAVFRVLRPYLFFGLGFGSRWENSQVRYNLIPTFRYEVSEPAAYFGTSVAWRIADEILLSVEFRYFQSARLSQNRFPSWGGSIVWGSWGGKP
ncbi:MAG: hypothetical protein FJY29_11565 [Betaproteobacteria bacterium]|nr:hypothetical protein [Betaproteobacteria bacterium]